MSQSLCSFEADVPIADILSALRMDGGIIIRNLVPEELMDQIYSEITSNSVNNELKTQGGELWPEGNLTAGGLAGVSPSYSEELLLQPRILEIADGMLLPMKRLTPLSGRSDDSTDAPDRQKSDAEAFAEFFEMTKNDAGSDQVVRFSTDLEKGPNCHHYKLGASGMLEIHRGGNNQFLHRENGIYQPFIEYIPEMREFIVSVNWAGTDFTLDNGATRLVPGSHKWPETRIAKESEIAQAVMSKGSAVLWLSRTLHGAGASKSEQGRTAFFASYVADWVRQEENQYITVPPETAEKLSERAQQIIGYRCSGPLGWVKGRSKRNLLREGKSGPL